MISKYKVTISGGPNFAYAYCIDKVTDKQKKTLDLSSWQMAFCGAEPIHVATANNFYNYFKDCGFRKECFSPCYGLAESTVFVCSSGLNKGHYIDFFSNTSLHNGEVKSVAFTTQDAKALVSVGQPIFNIKIVDPQTHRIVPPETVGEIWIEKNDSTAQGYWNRPELTQEVFLATLQDNALEHYYLRTGDLGFIYNNQLFICGRIKDLIIIHGANIYPQDIEFTVSHAHSSVKDSYVAAFGVDVGEEEKLAIVCGVKEGLDYDSIIHAIHLAVSREHQIPVYCIALIKPGSLPKTTSGKIQRRFSRELLLNGELPLLKLWNANQPLVSNKAVEISNPKVNSAQLSEFIISKIAVKAELKPEAIDVDKPLTELGIDSIGAVELAEELGIFLGKKIDVGLFWDYPTVNMLLAYITQDPDISKLSNISHAYHPGVGKRGIFKKAGKTGILIIHGFSGTPGEMLELGTYLWRENITVAIPQLSGHCGSAKEFKLSNRHDWYRSVLSAYNLLLEHCDQIFISGLSIGGLLGLQLAAEQQKKLSGVILLSPVFFYDGWNMSKFRTNFLMPMIIHTPLRFLTSFKEKSPYGVKDEQVRQAIEVVMQSQIRDFSEQIGIMKISGVSLKEVDRLIRDTKRLLSQVNCPTLVIHSLEDDMASTRNAEFVQREIGTQKIELYYLIDCYHVITLDKKKREVAEKVLSFLKVGDQRPEYKG